MGASLSDQNRAQLRDVVVIIFVLFAFAVPLYRWCWPLQTTDMDGAYLVWYDHILTHGRIAALGIPIGNYNPPYLYLLSISTLFDGLALPATIIKLLSVVITGALAAAVFSLLRVCNVDRRRAAATSLAIFIVPTVALNAAYFAQNDALWVAPSVMAVAAAIRQRPVAMLIWCGVAFSVKLQAIFLAPFIVGCLLTMRPKFWYWAVPAVAYVALMLPAVAFGWPVSDLATIYLRQSQAFGPQMNINAPNVWLLLSYGPWLEPARLFQPATAFGAIVGLFIVHRTMITVANAPNLLLLALCSTLAIPYFLPGMHERYFFLVDILAISLCCVLPSWQTITIAALVQIGSLGAYLLCLTEEHSYTLDRVTGIIQIELNEGKVLFYGPVCAAAMTAALSLVIWQIVKLPKIVTAQSTDTSLLAIGVR